jgi:hypothetical protein
VTGDPTVKRTKVLGAGSLSGKQRQEKYASVYANQRNSAFCGLDRRVRARFVGGDGDLPLPNPVNGAILPTKTPGIWPMSVNGRIETIDLINASAALI